MDKRLYQSGHIALPIQKVNTTTLAQFVNFIVIDSISGYRNDMYPNPLTGQLELTGLAQISYKLVYREILPQKDDRQEEFVERLIQPLEAMWIPLYIVQILLTERVALENMAMLNQVLAQFWFRGAISKLVLVIDEAKLIEIVTQKEQPQAELMPPPPPPMVDPMPFVAPTPIEAQQVQQ